MAAGRWIEGYVPLTPAERSAHYRKNHPAAFQLGNMLTNARKRAKESGLPFSITKEDIVIPEVCPVFGTPIVVADGTHKSGPQDNSPSLDRIRPALGYVPGNVRVISYKANRLRNNGTFVELMQVAIDAARIHNVFGDL